MSPRYVHYHFKNHAKLLIKKEGMSQIYLLNNWSYNSGANSTMYNAAVRSLPLSSHIFIWTSSFCFAVTKSPYATSTYLSVYACEPGIKSKFFYVMLQVAPESKTQLISCEMSPKYLLELSALEDVRSKDTYIFCNSLWSVLFSIVLSIFIDLYA